jgi:hypothetical protein
MEAGSFGEPDFLVAADPTDPGPRQNPFCGLENKEIIMYRVTMY